MVCTRSQSAKKKKVSAIETMRQEDEWENLSIPGIEASSTGMTTPTSTTSNSTDSIDAVASGSAGENQTVSPSESSILTSSSYMKKDSEDVKTEVEAPTDDIYVSKEDLVLLLPTETYNEYESMVQDDRDQKRSDRELRKVMIQQELDTLLRLMEQNEMDDGQEIEPEAEEALGIAANRVCYKKKYYDVARCDYVFVPSVAYTVMDGSLLDEASKHYFGQSEEFLVTYAAALGSAVLSQKNYKEYLNVGEEIKLAEDIDLTENTPKNLQQKNETVSDLFLGVTSPRNMSQSMGEKDWSVKTTFSETNSQEGNRLSSKGLTKKQRKKLKLFVGAYCTLVAFFSVLVLFLRPQNLDWNLGDVDENLPTVRAGPFQLFKTSNFLIPGMDLLKLSPQRYVISEKRDPNPATKMLDGQQTYVSSTDVAIAQRRKSAVSKRPIAANLLYHH